MPKMAGKRSTWCKLLPVLRSPKNVHYIKDEDVDWIDLVRASYHHDFDAKNCREPQVGLINGLAVFGAGSGC